MVKNSLRKKAKAVAMEEERYYSDENESADDGSNGSSEEDDIEYLSIATGLDTNYAMDMVDVLRQAEENNLNFVCVPLFHPRLRVGEIARNCTFPLRDWSIYDNGLMRKICGITSLAT